MTHRQYTLRIGRFAVDLQDPRPEQIDLEALEANLDKTLRWTSNPDALSVRQHQIATAGLAVMGKATPEVVEWCAHHDDHEGIIGDITGPIKALIALETPFFARLENKLDAAICSARGITYPTDGTRASVHYFDKLSETLEWRYVLGREPTPWLRALPIWMSEAKARAFICQHKDL